MAKLRFVFPENILNEILSKVQRNRAQQFYEALEALHKMRNWNFFLIYEVERITSAIKLLIQ